MKSYLFWHSNANERRAIKALWDELGGQPAMLEHRHAVWVPEVSREMLTDTLACFGINEIEIEHPVDWDQMVLFINENDHLAWAGMTSTCYQGEGFRVRFED